MRIGIALPTNQERLSRRALLDIAVALDEAGCASLWVNDHLAAFPITAEHPYRASPRPDWHPEMPQYEALATCAFLAAATTRSRIGVAALVLPQRHAIEVAKTTATLADLSDGRFVLGVGAGWSTREIRLLGAEPEGRGARLERQIAVLRAAWGTGPRPAGLSPDAGFAPRPHPHQVPQILVAGVSRAARDRALRCGDGWLPVARDDATVRLLGRQWRRLRETGRPLRGVLKAILPGADPRTTIAQAAEDGWDELFFELATWDLRTAITLLR